MRTLLLLALAASSVRGQSLSTDDYLIFTDHRDVRVLSALRELARARSGQLTRVEDLRLDEAPKTYEAMLAELRERTPRYVVFVPRLKGYSENTVLAMWRLLAAVDDDPLLDASPGCLVAPTPESLVALIVKSAAWKPVPLRACAVTEVPPDKGMKGVKITATMRSKIKRRSPLPELVVHTTPGDRAELPSASGVRWEIDASNGRLLPSLPSPARAAMRKANLVTLIGHGEPGRACGLRVSAFGRDELSGTVLFSVPCFSMMGQATDLRWPHRTPSGRLFPIQGKRLGLHAIEQGAIAVVGHMNASLDSDLLPMLEACLSGRTLGDGFKVALNRVIRKRVVRGGRGHLRPLPRGHRMHPGSVPRSARALYVLIGDPAIVPWAAR